MEKIDFKSLLKNLEKKYGEGIVMKLDNSHINKNIETFKSGSLLLDEAIGIGGYPRGRIIEIFGPESSGKTSIALLAIAEIQKLGEAAALIDAEHAIDIKMVERLGVDTKSLIVSQPNSGEQAFEILEHLIDYGGISLVVIDSVAALTPMVEIEGKISDQTIGLQARLMAKFLRKISAITAKKKVTIIFINQLRDKIGSFFGNSEVTPGGRSLKFYSSLRLDLRKKELIRNRNLEVIGQVIKIKIVKNKVASPYRIAELEFYYDTGINKVRELALIALKKGILTRKGSWFYYGELRISQGMDNVVLFLNQDENLKIKSKINSDLKNIDRSKVISKDKDVKSNNEKDINIEKVDK